MLSFEIRVLMRKEQAWTSVRSWASKCGGHCRVLVGGAFTQSKGVSARGTCIIIDEAGSSTSD